MKTTSPATVAGTSTYNDERPPLYTAFSLVSKRPSSADQNSADKEEQPWYEGAD